MLRFFDPDQQGNDALCQLVNLMVYVKALESWDENFTVIDQLIKRKVYLCDFLLRCEIP